MSYWSGGKASLRDARLCLASYTALTFIMRYAKSENMFVSGHLKPWLRTAVRSHARRLSKLEK